MKDSLTTTFGNKRTFFLVALVLVMVCLLTATAVVYSQPEPCKVAITGDTIFTSNLTSDCSSTNRRGNNAKFYTISPSERATVTITLETSNFDPYLYLMRGDTTRGTVVTENDDDDGNRERSKITRTLAAGTYTIEATSYYDGMTGEFTITFDGLPGAPAPTPTATPLPTNTPTPGATLTPLPTPRPTAAPIRPGPGTGATLPSLASGPGHVCVLYSTGQVGCRTVAATGETSPTVASLTAPAGDQFVGITTGDNHVCALTGRDVLICEG